MDASQPGATRIAELRPNGAFITMLVPPDVPQDWTSAALLRQEDDHAPSLMHTLSPDESQRQLLQGSGITVVDQDLESGRRYGYVTALYDADDMLVWSGDSATFVWHTPPPAPQEPTVRPMSSLGSRLSWTPRVGWGVLVLRRTLGSADASMQRHAFIDDDAVDVYVDRDVSPGTGYVYRLAHAKLVLPGGLQTGYKVLGLPGPEIYAVVPER